MALIAVAQPNRPREKKTSTFEQVLQGLQVAGQLINTGANVADAFQRSRQIDIQEKNQQVEEQKLKANLQKDFVSIKPEEVPNNPSAFSISFDGTPNYYTTKASRLPVNSAIDYTSKGLGRLVQADQINDLRKGGSIVLPTEGDLGFLVEGDALSRQLREAELSLKKAQAIKTQKEAEQVGMPDQKEQIGRIDKLIDQRENSPVFKNTQSSKTSILKIRAGANDPSAFGDLSLIKSFERTLDPGSSVREGEFAVAASTGSLGQNIQSWYAKITAGERLSPEQRQDIAQTAERLHKAQLIIQAEADKDIISRARSRGISDEDIYKQIIREYGPELKADAFEGLSKEQAEIFSDILIKSNQNAAQPQSQPKQEPSRPKIVKQNGVTFILNERTGNYEQQ